VTVIDASSFAAYVLREEGWETIEAILREAPDSVELLPVETANAVITAKRRRRLEATEALEALHTVRDLSENAITLLPHTSLLESAGQIALDQEVTLCDAIYIALARQRRTVLASRDQAQARAAKSLGVRVLDA
jgi:predicted nucleic acid-binding protein